VHFSWHAFNSGTITLRKLNDILRLWRAAEQEEMLPGVVRYGEASGTSGFLERGLFLARRLWNIESLVAPPHRSPTATRALVARRLLRPRLVVAGNRRREAFQRIAYWSLLPRETASVGFLFRDAIRDARIAEVYGDVPPRNLEIAATVSKLAAALMLCLLPVPRRFLERLLFP